MKSGKQKAKGMRAIEYRMARHQGAKPQENAHNHIGNKNGLDEIPFKYVVGYVASNNVNP